MRLGAEEARRRFLREPRAVLGTLGEDGAPHLVPVTFVHLDGHLYIAVDHKPKSTTDLKRLRNIERHSEVSLLADHYADDWTRLWWARADGNAAVTAFHQFPAEVGEKLHALFATKYAQYAVAPPRGPVIDIDIHRWSGWSSADL